MKAGKIKGFLLIAAFAFTMLACNSTVSQDTIKEAVKADIEKVLKEKGAAMGVVLTIQNFEMVSEGGNKYSGALKTMENDKEFNYKVKITAESDGKTFNWEIVQ